MNHRNDDSADVNPSPQSMNIFQTLKFAPELESEFREAYTFSSLRQVRIGALLATLLMDLFLLYELKFLPEIVGISWKIRFFYLTPVILLWYWSSYQRWFVHRMQTISTIVLILVGVGYMEIGLLAPPQAMMPKFAGPIILTIYLYSAAKLWFVPALVAGWSVLLVHAIGYGQSGLVANQVLIEGLSFVAAANLIGMIGAYQLERSIRKNFTQTKEIEHERNLSEELLLNILPAPIAERLKSHETAIADGFDEVTIMFADIVGFTELSSVMKPPDLVKLLNDLFSKFDEISANYGLEKIKTIGDAYMAVAGLPLPDRDHAANVARAALAMRDAAPNYSGPDGAAIAIRIGIHTGPVVAGVIGLRKFIYDLWGDAVNIASRMETHGLPGAIQVSEATRSRLVDSFDFEPRGEIVIKGKGKLVAFMLLGERSA